eukprot:SAG31_NODE_18624_length_629_cov_0.873585_1_plen_22_part_10
MRMTMHERLCITAPPGLNMLML